MKTKFLLPMLAIIYGVGMSFTSVELGENLASDYIHLNGNWMPIPEIDCGMGPRTCEVKLSDGSIHVVYDTQSLSSVKDTGSKVPFEL